MKKTYARITAIFMCLVLCLSMFACSKPTLSDYVNSDDFQSQVKELSSSYESQGITLEVTTRDNSLVYKCQYTEDMDAETLKLVKESLDTALAGSSMTSAFSNILSTVKEAVPETESIIVEYLDKDGNVITSYEYK